jgi:hypothetical protein
MTDNAKALVPIEEKQVDFYGDGLPAVLVEIDQQGHTQIHVPLRPICDFLGLNWSAQTRRLGRDAVLSDMTSTVAVTATDGRLRNMTCLPLDYLNGWLFGVNASRVKEDLREKVIRYQRDCYRVLAGAFLDRSLPVETSPTMTTLLQVREMGRAIMQMAEEQMEFEARLSVTEERLDQAATVVGDLTQRMGSLERRVAPGQPVTEEQASQVSQSVKGIALILTKQSGSSQFGAVYGELYRKFGITSYKMLPAARFDEAMQFLTEWQSSLVGEEPF